MLLVPIMPEEDLAEEIGRRRPGAVELVFSERKLMLFVDMREDRIEIILMRDDSDCELSRKASV